MRNTKSDRRSERTRRLLHAALLDLMQERRYDTITVQDIIDRANVGRSTFYAHFLDKEDLLVSGFTRVLDALTEHVAGPGQLASRHLTPLLRHIQEHEHLYRALTRGGGIDLLFKQGRARLRERIEQYLATLVPPGGAPATPIPLLAEYIVGSLLTMVTWWLDNRMPLTPEELDDLFHRLVLPGALAAVSAPRLRPDSALSQG